MVNYDAIEGIHTVFGTVHVAGAIWCWVKHQIGHINCAINVRSIQIGPINRAINVRSVRRCSCARSNMVLHEVKHQLDHIKPPINIGAETNNHINTINAVNSGWVERHIGLQAIWCWGKRTGTNTHIETLPLAAAAFLAMAFFFLRASILKGGQQPVDICAQVKRFRRTGNRTKFKKFETEQPGIITSSYYLQLLIKALPRPRDTQPDDNMNNNL
ncbi:hypothetical protein B0H14DRAFT_2560642 [Mycena olivaceomarginata]|nr:hypothetical protein B0H14DRAFT_2560642 [Mycena olivaceomarginata]